MPAAVGLVKSSEVVNQNRGEGLGETIGSLAARRRLCAHWLVVDSVSTLPDGVHVIRPHAALAVLLNEEMPVGAEFHFEPRGVLGAAVGLV